MPLSWRAGSWLLYFLIQVNYLIAFAFNLALGNPASRDDDSITITCRSGQMIFRRLEEHEYTLTMTLLGNEFTYRLTVVLRTTPLAPQERPTDDQVGIPRIDAFASSIPALPMHTPNDLWIVPPGVPFRVPCPRCQCPLEVGEFCYCAGETTILRQGPEAELAEHHRNPFLFLQNIGSVSTRATPATTPASSISSDDIYLETQHADHQPTYTRVPANVPAGQLCVRESMGRPVNGTPPSTGSRIPRSATRCGRDDVRLLPGPSGSHTPRDHSNLENRQNNRRRRTMAHDGGPTLPVPPPSPVEHT